MKIAESMSHGQVTSADIMASLTEARSYRSFDCKAEKTEEAKLQAGLDLWRKNNMKYVDMECRRLELDAGAMIPVPIPADGDTCILCMQVSNQSSMQVRLRQNQPQEEHSCGSSFGQGS